MVRMNIIEVERQWIDLLVIKGEVEVEIEEEVEEEVTDVDDNVKIEIKQEVEDTEEIDNDEDKVKFTCRLCLKEFENIPDTNHIENLSPLIENVLDLKNFQFNINIPTRVCNRCKDNLVMASQVAKLCSKVTEIKSRGKCFLCGIKCRPSKTENPLELKDLAFWLSGEQLEQPIFRYHDYCYACMHKLKVAASLRMRSHRIEEVLEIQFRSSLMSDVMDTSLSEQDDQQQELQQQIQYLFNDYDDVEFIADEPDVIDEEAEFIFGVPVWNEMRESFDDTDEECYPVPLNKPFSPIMLDCDFCNFKTSSDIQLHIHMDVEHMTQGTSCDLCGVNVKTPVVLKNHRRRIHYANISDLCHICGKSFSATGNYDLHMTTHAESKDVVCKHCGNRFVNQKNLKLHLRVHTGEKPYPCHYCEKKFSHPSDRKRHETIHTGIYPYNCSTCGRGFVKKSTFKAHEAGHGITNSEEQMIIMEVVKEEEV